LQTTSDVIVLTTVAAGTGTGAVIDLSTRRVPNPLTVLLAAIGIALAATGVSGLTVAASLAGFGLGLVLMLPGHLIGAMGAGDVKLFAAVGALIGPARIATAFIDTAIAGGAIAVIVALRRRRLRQTLDQTAKLITTRASNTADIESPHMDNRFAYAPAIAIGTIVAAFPW
jgi:prepilin peptidase CpaA